MKGQNMVQESQGVRSTSDYKQFKFVEGNRDVHQGHVGKLTLAMTENPELLKINPIIVNENMEIIDGQHRFLAAKAAKVPVYYVQYEGLSSVTARSLNILQRNWGMLDYITSFAKAGNKHYQMLLEFREKYPRIPVSSVVIACSEEITHNGGEHSRQLKSGAFRFREDVEAAENMLEVIHQVQLATDYRTPVSRATTTAIKYALRHEDFDAELMLAHVNANPSLITRTSTVKEAMRMVEDAYNYRLSSNQIRLT